MLGEELFFNSCFTVTCYELKIEFIVNKLYFLEFYFFLCEANKGNRIVFLFKQLSFCSQNKFCQSKPRCPLTCASPKSTLQLPVYQCPYSLVGAFAALFIDHSGQHNRQLCYISQKP
ncbi:hypothetical protein GDO86_009460 [Hymenochirus boettgeri]|uniref:Uncharacterized protein n=1 Tax=Hymenochirus boettgeri TaxID=247094 RepID=A0A8T2JG50_9PIPI|nr:hypothetical protein GDO86_009460 [Hymenochirus boettgeri]